MRLVVGLLLMNALGGCAGVFGGTDEDVASRGAFSAVVRRQHRSVSFPLSEALPSAHGRVWFFGGYTPDAAIEKSLGYPWSGAPQEVAENSYVVVIDNGRDDVQGFTLDLPRGVFAGCFPVSESVRPTTRFVLHGPVPGEGPLSNYLESARAVC